MRSTINVMMMLLFFTYGCMSKKANTDETTGEDLAESLDFSEPDATMQGDFSEPAQGEVVTDFSEPAPTTNTEAMVTSNTAEMGQGTLGELRTYTVQKSETLMLISFKLYGDYTKWRELAKLNDGKLGKDYQVSEGTTLSYYPPVQDFTYAPSGNPYLIKYGDTLGTISKDTYGTNKFWKDIWTNNKTLIKDPNLIFAGFTIYTPILDQAEVAKF